MTTIFVHIPRTGGTVFTQTLDENVPKERIFHFDLSGPNFPDGNFAPAVRRSSDMEMMYFSDQSQELNFMVEKIKERARDWWAGHFTYNVHQCLGVGEYRYVSIVRNPVDRVWSYFNLMMQPLSRPVNRLEPLFVKYERNLGKMLDSQEFPEFSNDQARILLGKEVSNNSNIGDVIKHVEQRYFYVGVTENLSKVVQEVGSLYSWTKFDIPPKPFKWDGPTPELAGKIRKYNAVDNALWQYVRSQGSIGNRVQ